MDAQHIKVIRRSQRAPNALWFSRPGEIHRVDVVSDQSREAPSAVSQVHIVEIGERNRTSGGPALRHDDEIRCVPHSGYGVEQGRIDPAENCAVRANSKCECEHRNRREAGRFPQYPEAVSQVLEQSFHLRSSPSSVIPRQLQLKLHHPANCHRRMTPPYLESSSAIVPQLLHGFLRAAESGVRRRIPRHRGC